MPTYHVPAERRSLPATDPLRWLIVSVEATTPCEAMHLAERDIWSILGRSASITIWAAVTYIPDFGHMQAMRDDFDAISHRKRMVQQVKTERVRTSMNSFSKAAFA